MTEAPAPLATPTTDDVRFCLAPRAARGRLLELLFKMRGMTDPTALRAAPGRSLAWTVAWLTRAPDDPDDFAEAERRASRDLSLLRECDLAAFDDGDARELRLPECPELRAPTAAAPPSAPPAAAPASAAPPADPAATEAAERRADYAARRRSIRAGQTTLVAGFRVNRNTLRSYTSLFHKALKSPGEARNCFRDIPAGVESFESWLATPRGADWLRANGEPVERATPASPASPAAPVVPIAPRVAAAPAPLAPVAPPPAAPPGVDLRAETFMSLLVGLVERAEDKARLSANDSGGARFLFELSQRMDRLREGPWTYRDHTELAAWINAGGLEGLHVPLTVKSMAAEGKLEGFRERVRAWRAAGSKVAKGRAPAPAYAGITRSEPANIYGGEELFK